MRSSDIVIIGGGAAGLMAAVAAASAGSASIVILERLPRCGAKILVSGGGRCNLTNSHISPDDYYGGSRNFIRNALASFGVNETVRFFESIGVLVMEEEDGRIFPKGGARHLLTSLLSRAKKLGVKIETSALINSICRIEDGFDIRAHGKSFIARRVIIACGGAACPACGTDGRGFSLARSLGHSIVTPTPALAPIELDEPRLQTLAGMTIDCSLCLCRDNREIARSRGQMLFTHNGISGPAALNLSRHIARHDLQGLCLTLSAVSDMRADELALKIHRRIEESPRAEAITPFREMIPPRLCERLFGRANVDPQKRLCALSRSEIGRLVLAFAALPLALKGVGGFEVAHATAGGVALREVRYQTMESRIARGLYLAGEVLDVDGKTGGYNFQWAWTSGFLAGSSAAISGKRIS